MDVDGGESGKWNDTRYRLEDVKKVLRKWQKGLHGKAWGSLFWNNHDQPRVVSRFGDTSTKEYWKRSAKMLGTALYFLEGTPYIYQGEELGMMNVEFDDIEEFRDIESLNAYREYVEKEKNISHEDMMRYLRKSSRDNARTPMQWNGGKNAGFTDGEPWIAAGSNYTWLNAEEQLKDDDSIFRYYQKMIRILRENPIVCNGEYEEFLKESEELYCYRRVAEDGEIIVCCNFTKRETEWDENLVPPDAQIILGNCKEHRKGIMQAYEAVVYQKL